MVYQFLGDVNLFHGRMENGIEGYLRPFDLEVTRAAQRADDDASLEAEIPRECYRELGIAVGDRVGVIPRKVRSFEESAGIVPSDTGSGRE